MKTLFTHYILPTKHAEPSEINENWLGKKLSFPLNGKNEKKIYLFSANTKNISSLRTREMTDIFNTFDDIYLVYDYEKSYVFSPLRKK